MIMMRSITVILAALAAAGVATNAAAQQAFGPSIEGTLGLHRGTGGTYAQGGGPAIDVVIAAPVRRAGEGAVVAGVTGNVTGALAKDLDCVSGPSGECIPDYPTFLSVAAVAGVQRALGRSHSARVLAGPAFYHAADGDGTLGLQGRADVARRLFFRTALVASVRGDLLPRYQGERLAFAAFGLGVRIQ